MDFQRFVESSKLHVLVPRRTDIDIEELVAHDDEESGEIASGLSSLAQRSVLYFGTFINPICEAPWSYSFLGAC